MVKAWSAKISTAVLLSTAFVLVTLGDGHDLQPHSGAEPAETCVSAGPWGSCHAAVAGGEDDQLALVQKRMRQHDHPPPSGIWTGMYTIQQKANMQYLDAHETEPDTYDYGAVTRKEQPGDDSQTWLINWLGGDEYTIQQKGNMRYLDAHLEIKDFGAATREEQTGAGGHDRATQIWVIKRYYDKTRKTPDEFTIQQKANMQYLDAHTTEPDTNDYGVVTRKEQPGDDSQIWVITRQRKYDQAAKGGGSGSGSVEEDNKYYYSGGGSGSGSGGGSGSTTATAGTPTEECKKRRAPCLGDDECCSKKCTSKRYCK